MTRADGEGSIYYRKRDDRWVAQFKPPGRPRRYKYRKSETAAKEALRELVGEYESGVTITRKKLAAHAAEWLEYKKSTLRRSVHARYTGIFNNNVLPYLGKIYLSELQPSDLTSLYKRLGKTISPATIGQVHRVLRECLTDAVYAGYTPRNPATMVRPPRVQKFIPQVLTVAQARRLLDAAKGDPLEAFYWLGIQGMRSGEICALKWDDVDLEGEKLNVRATIFWDKEGWHLDEPKTKKSRREVELMPPTVDVLKRRKIIQLEERMAAGPKWNECGFVFNDTIGRPLRQSTVLRHKFRPLLKQAHFSEQLQKMRVHDLRHSAASILIAAGMDIATVSGILGHSSVAVTTAIYAHMLPGMGRKAADTLSGQLGHYVVRVTDPRSET